MLPTLPTKLLKTVVDPISFFIVEVFNRSLSTGYIPENFKTAYITMHLKKSNSVLVNLPIFGGVSPIISGTSNFVHTFIGSLRTKAHQKFRER